MRKPLFKIAFIFFTAISPVFISAQPDKFKTPEGNPAGLHTVYRYQKSNWDGTHRSDIFLYISSNNRLESYKWSEGDHVATLVTAWIDWNNFSISRFENHRIEQNKEPQLRAVLEAVDGSKVKIELGDYKDTAVITAWPWHSYDFDFAGLGYIWRALKNKETDFVFHRADPGMLNGKPAMVNMGEVKVKFLGHEKIDDTDCLKYSIDGAGLENKGGTIWIDPETWMIQRYTIALPDEEGFENGYLNLLEKKKMTPEEWERFKKEKVQ